MSRSRSSTSACIPRAMAAAFMPETPAPMTTTLAAYTPLTPPISTPRPPWARMRVCAPTCGASGREVEVGEQGLPLAHPVVLRLDGLLDLEDQVPGGPHLVRAVEDPGPG